MQSQSRFPYNHLSRLYSPEILNTIKEMRQGETWDYACERKKQEYEPLIAQMMRRGKDRDTAIEELITKGTVNRKFLNRYYWSAYTRLAWSRPALTITANANFLGSGRFTHPVQQRGITMREAARLQSFEDDFKFITSATDDLETTTIGTGLDMIGEAVPPLLAKKFAEHIADLLDTELTRKKQRLPVAKIPAVSDLL
jgi:DNA (cytosine-5)-methyltransferase 1